MRRATASLCVWCFDLLALNGRDLRSLPLETRKAKLSALLNRTGEPRLRLSHTFSDGEKLLHAAAQNGLEGIVSKRRTAPYAVGRRSADWRKTAHRSSLSVVVGGWRKEVGSDGRLGAVLVGLPDGAGGWRYAGRVGSGLAGTAGEALALRLRPLARSASPFADEVPALDANGTTWVEPRVVIEVRTLELTGQHRLRQPAYLGVRSDLSPADLEEVDDA